MELNRKSFKTLRIAVVCLLAIILLLPALPQKALAANGPTYKNIGLKDDDYILKYGYGCSILGTVSSGSGYNLQYVEAIVYTTGGKKVTSSGAYNLRKGSYTLKGSQVDNGLKFGSLSGGDYYMVIKAADTKGNSSTSSRVYFSVRSDLKISGFSVDTKNMKRGKGCNINGTISSNYKITKARITLKRYANGKYTNVQQYEYNPGVKSFKIKESKLNDNIKFGQEPAGTYVLYLEVWDSTNTFAQSSISDIKIQ